jgi:excisionase family DNA binding protein
MLNLERLLTPREAAEILRVNAGTLAVWRCTNRYPLKFVKIGRHIRYRESDVKQFIENLAA